MVLLRGFRARLKKILEQSEVCRPHDKGLLTIKKKKKIGDFSIGSTMRKSMADSLLAVETNRCQRQGGRR